MTNRIKAIPEGYHTLTPHLVVNGASQAIEFYKEAFGAEEITRVPGPDGKLTQFAHASSIEILTPEGTLAQYYMGVLYSAQDLSRQAGELRSSVDRFLANVAA